MNDLTDLEASNKLELALVAFLKSLQGGGNPLDAVTIYPGHGEASLDNVTSKITVTAERSDTQSYWHSGLEVVDVKILIETQADDTLLVVHNRRVNGMRIALGLKNLANLKTFINAPLVGPDNRTVQGFQLSGWGAGKPPLQDGFDKDKNLRQALFRFIGQCGNQCP